MVYGVTSIKVIYKKSLRNKKIALRKVLDMTCVEVTPPSKISDGVNDYERKSNREKAGSAVKSAGGVAPKFVSPGFDGMPDRIVLLPGGHLGFVEVKATGEKPRPLQLARHGLLRRLGFKVYVLDGERQIERIITEIGGDAE